MRHYIRQVRGKVKRFPITVTNVFFAGNVFGKFVRRCLQPVSGDFTLNMPTRGENKMVALDDLFHATLLIILLMGSFAGIATWRFGTIREDFSSLGTSFLTNFMMMFGNFPDDWTGQEFWTPLTPELMVYTILYFLVVFLLMQNFLLAIVVEAYMAVAEENHLLETGALCQDLLL